MLPFQTSTPSFTLEGFYKNDNGELLFAPNFVENKDYQLYKEHHSEYNYPIDGWYWFDSEEEAARAYNERAKILFGEFACFNVL